MKVFFDTSAFIAFLIDNEKDHPNVVSKYREYREQRALFLTSYYVLDELFTRLMYDFGKNISQKIIRLLNNAIQQEELAVLDIDKATFEKAVGFFLKFSEHKISLTDATTYVLYRDFKLDEIFTLDSNFKKIGATTSF